MKSCSFGRGNSHSCGSVLEGQVLLLGVQLGTLGSIVWLCCSPWAFTCPSPPEGAYHGLSKHGIALLRQIFTSPMRFSSTPVPSQTSPSVCSAPMLATGERAGSWPCSPPRAWSVACTMILGCLFLISHQRSLWIRQPRALSLQLLAAL